MSSAFHVDNEKKDILILGKDPTDGLDDNMLTAEKERSINFTEQHNKFCLILHFNGENRYVFVNNVEICKFKTKDSEINPALLRLGNV